MFLILLVIVYIVILTYRVLSDAFSYFFFFQAEDGIRDLVRSRGLGDVYKRQGLYFPNTLIPLAEFAVAPFNAPFNHKNQ